MKRGQFGVTLIELMIVIVVVSILTAIAVPSYRGYVIRASRADAKVGLGRIAATLERCYTNSTPFAYDGATCNAAVVLPVTTEGGKYRIDASVRTATAYTLTATPLGVQANDTQCGTFSLTHSGIQTVSGTYSATPLECWRR
jgi:type IV pilus assembly protein PilE